jgi:hypothetical protein
MEDAFATVINEASSDDVALNFATFALLENLPLRCELGLVACMRSAASEFILRHR